MVGLQQRRETAVLHLLRLLHRDTALLGPQLRGRRLQRGEDDDSHARRHTSGMSALMDEFLAAAAPDAYEESAALESQLAAVRARGCAAWPQLALSEAALGRDLGQRVGERRRDLGALHA